MIKKSTNAQTVHSKALRGATANSSKQKQLDAGTHKRLAAKHMKADVYDQLQTAWEQSNLQWDDFVISLLNKK